MQSLFEPFGSCTIMLLNTWLALAAKCKGVSPLTVGTSGLASCCRRKITMFIHPMKAATWRGVNPDSVVADIPKKIHIFKSLRAFIFKVRDTPAYSYSRIIYSLQTTS